MFSPCEICEVQHNKECGQRCSKCDYTSLIKMKNDIIGVLRDTRYSDDECMEKIMKITGIYAGEGEENEKKQ